MSAPESPTSADQALSSLMGAVGGNPEASRLESAPVAPPRDWKTVQAAIDDYLEGYELRLDEGCHTPTEFEKFLLVDAVAGLMEDDEFIGAMLSAITAAPSPERPQGATVSRLTPKQGAIISAFTGILAGGFSDFQEYAEAVLGRVIWTHEFSDKALMSRLKDAARADFQTIAAQQGKGGEA